MVPKQAKQVCVGQNRSRWRSYIQLQADSNLTLAVGQQTPANSPRSRSNNKFTLETTWLESTFQCLLIAIAGDMAMLTQYHQWFTLD